MFAKKKRLNFLNYSCQNLKCSLYAKILFLIPCFLIFIYSTKRLTYLIVLIVITHCVERNLSDI